MVGVGSETSRRETKGVRGSRTEKGVGRSKGGGSERE